MRIAIGLAPMLVLILAGCSAADEAPVASLCTGVPDGAMVWVEGGSFPMGKNPRYPEEGPTKLV